MNAIGQLNAVPFEVYLAFAVAGLVLAAISSATLRLFGLHWLSRCLLHGGAGAAAGFLVLTTPWLVNVLRITKTWPLLDMWPFWGGWSSGPFTASALGSSIGVMVAVFICSRRRCVDTA